MLRYILTLFAFTAVLSLSACSDSDEKAEEFYQSGLSLLAEGDLDRAAVEFRNVFRYNGQHEDARRQLAQILEAKGNSSKAYRQYLRLAEQYPELADARQALARIAISSQNWEQAERHGRVALELAPDAAISKSIAVSLDYRQAALDKAPAKQEALAQQAAEYVAADPEDLLSRRIVITHNMSSGRPSAALPHLDAAIAQDPDEIAYYVIKLQALEALQDMGEIEALLKAMYQQFPDNQDVQQTLINFYMQRQDLDQAEALLRDLAGEDTGPPGGFATVIQFLGQVRGPEAAADEVNRLIAANADVPENAAFYRALRASFTFDNGETEAAIAEMQDILADAPETDQTRRFKGTLATMLLQTGNQVGGRALVEEILASDASNVVALKLRAELLIDGDKPGEAIIDLRRALDQSPRDTSILLLLARAHERNGSAELQGERLATAVDVSEGGVRESLLYAAFLLRNDRSEAARAVLADARKANPNNLEVLAQSAQLALQNNQVGLVRGIIADVEKLQDRPGAPELLQSLQTAVLLQQDRVEEGLEVLQGLAGSGGENARAVYAVIQTQLRTGKLKEARRYLDGLLKANAEDLQLQMMNAALYVAEGNAERSEEILRTLIKDNPDFVPAISQLYIQLRREGRPEEASTLLTSALDGDIQAPRLLLLRAGELEEDGDIEGAIEIYEALYTLNTNNVLIANNLASLLSTFRDDADSQSRAAAVARRLRGTEVPAFQDTYGWVAYQQGELEEALSYLEPAAAALETDPLVQYHLGITYAALERKEDAQAALERAIELAGPDSTLPQMTRARETLQSLKDN